MDDAVKNQSEPLVISIPAAGKMAGLSVPQSYRAAKAGFIPTVPLSGHRAKVPLKKWRAVLNGDDQA